MIAGNKSTRQPGRDASLPARPYHHLLRHLETPEYVHLWLIQTRDTMHHQVACKYTLANFREALEQREVKYSGMES